MTCEECKSIRLAGIARSEGEATRQHHVIRWLVIVIALQFILNTASWGFFLWYESQFSDTETSYEVSTDGGGTAIANGEGNVNYYGESESNSKETNP